MRFPPVIAVAVVPVLIGLLFLAAPAVSRAGACDIGGFDRPCLVEGGTYRARLPEGDGPFPTVIFLYGAGGESKTIAGDQILDLAVVARGYALVVPSARTLTYAGGVRASGWSLRHEPTPVREEAAFLRAVIADARRRLPIDPARVIIAGYSRGGFLVWELACHEPDLATAFAAIAGGYLGPLPERCAGPVRFLATQGTADRTVPIGGRRSLSAGLDMAPLLETLRLLARSSGCAQEPRDTEPLAGFERRQWRDCQSAAQLDLLLHEGGHELPAAWFRALIDWFEEAPAPSRANAGRRLGAGQRSPEASGRFRAPPSPGGRRLPVASE